MCHHVDMEIGWEAVVEDRESEPEEFATAEDADERAVDSEASTPVTPPADD